MQYLYTANKHIFCKLRRIQQTVNILLIKFFYVPRGGKKRAFSKKPSQVPKRSKKADTSTSSDTSSDKIGDTSGGQLGAGESQEDLFAEGIL